MCPQSCDPEEGRAPLSNVGIDDVPRHHDTEPIPHHSATPGHERTDSIVETGGNKGFLQQRTHAVANSFAMGVVNAQTQPLPKNRYTLRMHYTEGDRVIVRVCEAKHATWRHGVVANLQEHPVRYEGSNQYAYPVFYPSGTKKVKGYYNPTLCEILYDEMMDTLKL